ncbi:MAG: hypothetical protein E7314_05275 [Clostridiales bacterium]|nr:hypothetical protein [Clostridiales bacterium]
MLEVWKKMKVGDICSISTGKKNTQDNIKNGRYPFFVRSDKIERIDTYSYEGEAVLTAGDGVGVGKVVHYINGKFDYHQRVYKMSNFEGVDGKFFYYCFKRFFYNRVKSMSAKNSVDSVRLDMIRDMEILIPISVKEQKKIADILTNIDSLIEYLQKTVEKKEKIFKAITQELLSGKKKIYEWKKIKIGDIGEFSGNGVDKKTKEDEQKIRLLNYMDIMHNNFIYRNISKHFVTASEEKISKCSVKKGDIFLTPSSETRLDIGISSVAMEDIDDLVYSYHIIRFRPKIEMDLLFRAYIFKNQKFLDQASTMCEGGGKRYVCSNKKFESFELEIPVDIREQQDIANKLYTMEKELDMLKDKLKKYKHIKEGMMEELLMGKVRLKYE